VDACPLDVLEEARDQDPLPVRDGVDVDLDALEVAIDPDGSIRIDGRRRGELPREVPGGVAELQTPVSYQDRRQADDRIGYPRGVGL
jgi:hypothetical protein